MKRLLIVAMAALLAAACTETKKAEPVYPVGDRAFFEVAGNVESIDFTQETGGELMFLYDKPTFTKEGLFFVKDIKYKETKEGDKNIEDIKVGDLVLSYNEEKQINCFYNHNLSLRRQAVQQNVPEIVCILIGAGVKQINAFVQAHQILHL